MNTKTHLQPAMESMTGFGECRFHFKNHDFVVETKSLNHKGIEVMYSDDGLFSPLEVDVITMVKSFFIRGKFFIRVIPLSSFNGPVSLHIRDSLSRYHTLLSPFPKISLTLGIEDLIKLGQKEIKFGVKKYKKQVLFFIRKALLALKEERKKEGKKINVVMRKGLKRLKSYLDFLEPRVSPYLEEKRKNFIKKIKATCKETPVLEERLVTETMIGLARSDVKEEIDRLQFHIAKVLKTDKEKNGSQGRTFDFYFQEMLREITTLSSKLGSTSFLPRIVSMRETVEALREQARNIE